MRPNVKLPETDRVILGVTATRAGMTPGQEHTIRSLLSDRLWPTELHHGACAGGDEEIALLVREICGTDCKIVAHPGLFANGRDNP